jgi:glycosyltransferase involved in cell wall biosynthesis
MSREPRPTALVDARALHASGIGRYLREILARLLIDERFGRIVLLGEPAALERFAAGRGAGARVETVAYPGGFYSPRTQLAWAARAAHRAARADVSFFPHYDAPFLRLPRASVVAVQDLTHFRVPAAFPAWKRAPAGVLFDRVVRSAGRVLISSDSTRADLLERVPEVAAKTAVIPLGVGAAFQPCSASGCSGCAAVRALGPYLLCVGNRKPHKNLAAAVEALARLLPECPELKLGVVGARFAARDEVDERAEALGVAHAVVERGGVDDDALRCLYTHAEALLFPSMYEGFGLPVLEAMACGTPVVVSNRTSLPDVVGDAGQLVEPHAPEAFAAAVRRLGAEPALRAELVRRGRERAARLSWERTAERTLDVLYEVAMTHRAPQRGAAERVH